MKNWLRSTTQWSSCWNIPRFMHLRSITVSNLFETDVIEATEVLDRLKLTYFIVVMTKIKDIE
jgi:sulfur relay (sulfurtransferase) DsrF/TusC family protein